jgi:hypothetical protein
LEPATQQPAEETQDLSFWLLAGRYWEKRLNPGRQIDNETSTPLEICGHWGVRPLQVVVTPGIHPRFYFPSLGFAKHISIRTMLRASEAARFSMSKS